MTAPAAKTAKRKTSKRVQRRKPLRRSAARVRLRITRTICKTTTIRYVVCRKVDNVVAFEVECRVCGTRWVVSCDGKVPPKGWRKCARGCNSTLLSQG